MVRIVWILRNRQDSLTLDSFHPVTYRIQLSITQSARFSVKSSELGPFWLFSHCRLPHVKPPSPWVHGGIHNRLRVRGWGYNSDEGRNTLVLYSKYVPLRSIPYTCKSYRETMLPNRAGQQTFSVLLKKALMFEELKLLVRKFCMCKISSKTFRKKWILRIPWDTK